MGEVWFTSDTHLGHEFVARIRGYDTVKDHDGAVSKSIHKRVRTGDDLWVLGDVALGDRAVGLRAIGQWPGRKHLVIGNHDRCHPSMKNAHAHQHEYLEVFDTVQIAARIRHGGETFLLSHFPYVGDGSRGGPGRFQQWRLPDFGTTLIHGHTHDRDRRTTSPAGTLQLHVGWDAWRGPVSLHELTRG